MKTSELTGAALDWAVARCEGLLCFGYRTDGKRFAVEDSDGQVEGFMPATDWAQGGPIIEREGISLTSYLDEEDPYWIGSVECQYKNFNATAYYEEYGPTPLIAAMRCYVVSKLGDTVDVPEELINV
jgi:hypothetical protein